LFSYALAKDVGRFVLGESTSAFDANRPVTVPSAQLEELGRACDADDLTDLTAISARAPRRDGRSARRRRRAPRPRQPCDPRKVLAGGVNNVSSPTTNGAPVATGSVYQTGIQDEYSQKMASQAQAGMMAALKNPSQWGANADNVFSSRHQERWSGFLENHFFSKLTNENFFFDANEFNQQQSQGGAKTTLFKRPLRLGVVAGELYHAGNNTLKADSQDLNIKDAAVIFIDARQPEDSQHGHLGDPQQMSEKSVFLSCI